MTRWAIVDTGPLVAFLDRRERHHTWAVEQMPTLKAPLLVCEPVLTEAMFLLSASTDARRLPCSYGTGLDPSQWDDPVSAP